MGKVVNKSPLGFVLPQGLKGEKILERSPVTAAAAAEAEATAAAAAEKLCAPLGSDQPPSSAAQEPSHPAACFQSAARTGRIWSPAEAIQKEDRHLLLLFLFRPLLLSRNGSAYFSFFLACTVKRGDSGGGLRASGDSMWPRRGTALSPFSNPVYLVVASGQVRLIEMSRCCRVRTDSFTVHC